MVGAIVYISPAIFFLFFGSGKVQDWNEPPTKKIDVEATNDVKTIAVTPTSPNA